jgi:hypothetical protein
MDQNQCIDFNLLNLTIQFKHQEAIMKGAFLRFLRGWKIHETLHVLKR